jgi:AraC-like DNA-binding protein
LASLAADLASFRFSTDHLPARDRVPIYREAFGRSVLRLDIEPLPDVPFHADMKLIALSGIGAVSASFCGTRERRTRELLADGNDAVGIAVNLSGPFIVAHRGPEVTLGDGEAILISCAEPGTFTRPSLGRILGVTLPHATLAPLVPNIGDALGRRIPRNSEALRMFTSYVGALDDIGPLTSPELRAATAGHLVDLFAMTLGASRDAAALAEGRGIRAARLRAIKAEVAARLGHPGFTVDAAARSQGITTRHLHRLFEPEGVSFSEFVLAARLAQAHRMLRDPQLAAWTIAAIADEVGFVDRSHFNRAFRHRYGASPSEMRDFADRKDQS